MGENQGGSPQGQGVWRVWAGAVTALALGAMLACFAAGQAALRPLEQLPGAPASPAQTAVAEERVNLNTAGREELETLPGIGPARAQAILDYRAEHGIFRYPEELIYVSGIGEGILKDLLELVTVEQP